MVRERERLEMLSSLVSKFLGGFPFGQAVPKVTGLH